MAAQVCAGRGQGVLLWLLFVMHSGSAKMGAEDETGGSWTLPRLLPRLTATVLFAWREAEEIVSFRHCFKPNLSWVTLKVLKVN